MNLSQCRDNQDFLIPSYPYNNPVTPIKQFWNTPVRILWHHCNNTATHPIYNNPVTPLGCNKKKISILVLLPRLPGEEEKSSLQPQLDSALAGQRHSSWACVYPTFTGILYLFAQKAVYLSLNILIKCVSLIINASVIFHYSIYEIFCFIRLKIAKLL